MASSYKKQHDCPTDHPSNCNFFRFLFNLANSTMTDTKMADSQHLEAAKGKVSGDSASVVSEKMSSQVKKKVSAKFSLL